MKLLNFDSFVNESLNEKNNNSEFLNSIFDNNFNSVEVSLKYATKASELFKDSFKRVAQLSHSNVFNFKSSDDLYSFIEILVNDMGIDPTEFELS